MLIARAPLRITFAGGGTDLPSFYSRCKDGGFCVTAAINKYVYVTLNHPFREDFVLNYRWRETVKRAEDIQHPMVRHALLEMGAEPPLEIGTQADVTAGTGLGSSGAFAAALDLALHGYHAELAEHAYQLERSDGQIAGKQDAYASALGGVRSLSIARDGQVTSSTIPLVQLATLEQRLLLFYTDQPHSASNQLCNQDDRCEDGEVDTLALLEATRCAGVEAWAALIRRDFDTVGKLLDAQWQLKRAINPHSTTPAIEAHYNAGCEAGGALGGKLVGAGGGGFLLFYTHDPARLRQTMTTRGLRELEFHFVDEGATLWRL